MKVFFWNEILDFLNTGNLNPFFEKGTGISVGSFDGLHKGHRKLLNTLVSNCKQLNLLSGVVTFSRPLPSIKHSDDYKGDISTLEQRLSIFESLGLDFAIIVDFTDDFSSMLGADFLNILVNSCNMEFLAEGIDFRCGYKGATDSQAIKYFAQKNNLSVIFMDPVYFDHGEEESERVSSSLIRTMILKGFFTTVSELLERNYELQIDTDNLTVSRKSILQVCPPEGVYHCKDENGMDVRVQISKNEIILSQKAKKIIFS